MSTESLPAPPGERQSLLARAGLSLSHWFERWFPDAFSLALVATLLVFAASAWTDGSLVRSARWFGQGYWDLAVFTVQMCMIIVTGYALAAAPVVFRTIERMAAVPRDPRVAVAFVALFSMLASLVSWSFSLVFSALLAREVARRVKGADYRALGAAAYLGVGSVWALGLSSSAALIMASPASLPDSVKQISGIIPLTDTLGLWQSWLVAFVLIVVSVAIAFASAPRGAGVKTMDDMGITPPRALTVATRPTRPGEWLEHSPILTVIVSAMGIVYLVGEVSTGGWLALLSLNTFIFAFGTVALLLHWRPGSFVGAITAAVPSVGGVLIQYPIYAGIIRMMTESGLATRLAHAFVEISTPQSFPVLVGIYSAALGLFVPSAGGKWLIEAPYVLAAAKELGVHMGWVVQTYNATEALANLIHPFWMLPVIGILGLSARDIIGYCMLQFIIHVPLVMFLVWALNYTL
ncbi:MAG: TIGR00366 family protein [Vicinamibacterales bacterium]